MKTLDERKVEALEKIGDWMCVSVTPSESAITGFTVSSGEGIRRGYKRN